MTESLHLLEDGVGGCDPPDGVDLGVIGVDDGADLVDELADLRERPAASRFLGDNVEPDLDVIEPGGVGRREVDVIARPSSEPRLDLDVLVTCIVVDDEMDLEIVRDVGVDVLEEL
ncbi:MAG: hypothetical protein Q8W49_02105 [Candidatus Palauibacterales bacterium]|nr:hypothetical protein [Candidatus Palauibacterales bacterium]